MRWRVLVPRKGSWILLRSRSIYRPAENVPGFAGDETFLLEHYLHADGMSVYMPRASLM